MCKAGESRAVTTGNFIPGCFVKRYLSAGVDRAADVKVYNSTTRGVFFQATYLTTPFYCRTKCGVSCAALERKGLATDFIVRSIVQYTYSREELTLHSG